MKIESISKLTPNKRAIENTETTTKTSWKRAINAPTPNCHFLNLTLMYKKIAINEIKTDSKDFSFISAEIVGFTLID